MRLGHVVSLNFTPKGAHRKAWLSMHFKLVIRWHIVTQVSLVSDSVTFNSTQVLFSGFSRFSLFIAWWVLHPYSFFFFFHFWGYLMVHQWNSEKMWYESNKVSLGKKKKKVKQNGIRQTPSLSSKIDAYTPLTCASENCFAKREWSKSEITLNRLFLGE